MSIRLRDLLFGTLEQLRHEPTDKRIRAVIGDRTVIDSTRALLVWEPKRIVPTYAVPEQDIRDEIGAASRPAEEEGAIDVPELAGRPVLDPSVPFSIRTTEGEPLTIRGPDGERAAAAFRPSDPALAGHLIVDFDGFDAWYEEDEPNVGHPRDPFHRIDVVRSSRQVRVEHGGEVLAESRRPHLLFEPPLPVRYYLPREDVRTDLLRPSDTTTFCAYKGEASYWALDGEGDVAWTYEEPLHDAAEVRRHVAFFNERIDMVVDGSRLERPVTPWSRR